MFGALIGGGLSLAGSLMGGNRALRAAELGAKSDADKLKFGIMGQREQGYGAAAGGNAARSGADSCGALCDLGHLLLHVRPDRRPTEIMVQLLKGGASYAVHAPHRPT